MTIALCGCFQDRSLVFTLRVRNLILHRPVQVFRVVEKSMYPKLTKFERLCNSATPIFRITKFLAYKLRFEASILHQSFFTKPKISK